MKEDNKIQIRVQSKTERRMMEDLDVEMITEWDVKKIAMALGCFVLLISSIVYYLFVTEEMPKTLNSSTKIEMGNKIENSPALKNPIAKKQGNLNKKEIVITQEKKIIKVPVKIQNTNTVKLTAKIIENNKYIKRALLVKRTINKEPTGEVELPLVVNKEKAISLTYFTEIVNMQGSSVYHEWLIDNKIIYKKKINILGKRWRISTRKLFPYTAIGQWQVRVVSNKGDTLHKIDFIVTK